MSPLMSGSPVVRIIAIIGIVVGIYLLLTSHAGG